MALMPKRVKHRKSQRGRIKGNATRGNTVVFGDFGLQDRYSVFLIGRVEVVASLVRGHHPLQLSSVASDIIFLPRPRT